MMEITLEKIELVKDRTGVSYKEAKEALERTEGNVVDAIIDIEESINELPKGKLKEGSAIIDKLKAIVKKGNVSKITIKKDDEIILNLPVNLGIVAGVIAPWATVAGIVAAFGTKCVIEVVKDDGTILDISEMTNETIGAAVEKGAVFADELKAKGAVVYEAVKEKGEEVYESVKEKGEEAYEAVKEKAKARKEGFDLDDDDDDFSCSPLDDDCGCTCDDECDCTCDDECGCTCDDECKEECEEASCKCKSGCEEEK